MRLPLALAALMVVTPVLAGDQISELAMHGSCQKMEAPGRNLLGSCSNSYYETQHADHTTSLDFPISSTTYLSFVTRASDDVEVDEDHHFSNIIKVVFNDKGNVKTLKSAGTCSYGNPYLGKSEIYCRAETAEGAFITLFLTDGKDPVERKF